MLHPGKALLQHERIHERDLRSPLPEDIPQARAGASLLIVFAAVETHNLHRGPRLGGSVSGNQQPHRGLTSTAGRQQLLPGTEHGLSQPGIRKSAGGRAKIRENGLPYLTEHARGMV